MRDYAQISPQFWIGHTGKAIRRFGVDAQVIALYLLSSPHSNMIGMYHLPVAYISADTGIPIEGASKGLAKLQQAGFCGYDQEAEVVWVYEMARYQVDDQLKPGDKRCSGVQNIYNSIPQNAYLPLFYDKYAENFHMKFRRGCEAPCKHLGSQEQEQEQEQEQDGSAPPASPATRAKKAESEESENETELQAACRETWAAYCDAFFNRYGTMPVRNKTVNSQVKNFVQRLGYVESPAVAAFYVQHPQSFYVKSKHQFGMALKDAEGLRTEWATNRTVTDTQARQGDRMAANANSADEAMRILEAQGAA